MIDLVLLNVFAGDGGNGRVSFLREKFRPKGGPDGGAGGHGGSVYLKASRHLTTLQPFAGIKTIMSQAGGYGGKRKQTGQKAEDVFIEVPLGTSVWVLAENATSRARRQFLSYEGHTRQEVRRKKYVLEKIGQSTPAREPDELRVVEGEDVQSFQDSTLIRSQELVNKNIDHLPKYLFTEMKEDGQTVLLCQGGYGGRGNDAFKSSTNTTPLEAEFGTFGERKQIILELKLLADVGLVGYPNAGKSTLLSVVTKAHPKIADYPFTTLEPQLGLLYGNVEGEGKELLLADIPGLVEGAHQGKGLGHTFLRHVEGCRVLLYMLFLEESVLFDEKLSLEQKAEIVFRQWQTLQNELQLYGHGLEVKPMRIALTKKDLYPTELLQAIERVFEKKRQRILSFSAVTGEGVAELKSELFTACVL